MPEVRRVSMTTAEHALQVARVTASEHRSERSAERHGTYLNRPRVVPGELHMADAHASEPTRDHAPRTTNAGHDGGSAAPSPICPRCHGEGLVTFNPGYPDPQTEDSETCHICMGAGTLPVRRAA